eukprot:12658173-Alexandrium_andersonii.AAC.1
MLFCPLSLPAPSPTNCKVAAMAASSPTADGSMINLNDSAISRISVRAAVTLGAWSNKSPWLNVSINFVQKGCK